LDFARWLVHRVKLFFTGDGGAHLLGAAFGLGLVVLAVIALAVGPSVRRRHVAGFRFTNNLEKNFRVRSKARSEETVFADPVVRDLESDHVHLVLEANHFPFDVAAVDAPELLVGGVGFFAGDAVVGVDASVAVGVNLTGVEDRIGRPGDRPGKNENHRDGGRHQNLERQSPVSHRILMVTFSFVVNGPTFNGPFFQRVSPFSPWRVYR